MAGTVTGKNAQIFLCAHSSQAASTVLFDSTKTQSTWAIADFSLTLDRGVNETDQLGQAGNYFSQGSLSVEGSLTAAKFATPGYADIIDNMFSHNFEDSERYKYLMVSGTVSLDTDATYFRWCLASCQVTGFDVSIGDADTVTEASVDFIMLNPEDLNYGTDCSGIKG